MQTTRGGFLKSVAGLAIAGAVLKRPADGLLYAQEKANVSPRSTRIRDVEIVPYSLEQKVVFHVALPTVPTSEGLFVRLRTEDGVVGWGEASPYSPVTSETPQSDMAMASSMASLIRHRDAFSIAKAVADMDALSPFNTSIKAAFEMALWDICGKVAEQPVCRLLGKFRESFETDKTVFIDTPQAMADTAREYVREGFRAIKIKVGESPEKDVERLRVIREAVGNDIAMRIDANQGWSPSDAVRSLHAIEKYEIQDCEQPTAYWDWQGLKYVRDHSPIPIMADESVHSPHDAIEAVRLEACDMINIKLMKSGGILNATRIAHIADAAGMTCMLGCMAETSLGLTAAAHVVASQGNIVYADLDSSLFVVNNPIAGGMRIDKGVVYLSPEPGFGLDVDPLFVRKLRPV
ncbi:MAG TPA: dipeptide epimerase [Terriglobales bacterium]|jgi:L-alanine-DL-glutamate epimerase-like enolase superfamily enzyme|nr:dipeptide epimerase [Terriglobales bacterium]